MRYRKRCKSLERINPRQDRVKERFYEAEQMLRKESERMSGASFCLVAGGEATGKC